MNTLNQENLDEFAFLQGQIRAITKITVELMDRSNLDFRTFLEKLQESMLAEARYKNDEEPSGDFIAGTELVIKEVKKTLKNQFPTDSP